jgi:ribosome-binding factor A
MKRRGPLRKDLQAACSEIGPEDGVDPRTGFRLTRPRVRNRKALQLAAQAAETLQVVLAGECGDDLLRELRVESVRPGPHSDHLVVTVTASSDALDLAEAADRLQRVSAYLRSEVAAAVHRRRAPQLSFQVVRAEASAS